ncbi:MAG TPA: PAS domain-containing protein [Vicinamibacterales bacterium]|nr:PAS domain-containing protein [Vicinamibacterales bacterium]
MTLPLHLPPPDDLERLRRIARRYDALTSASGSVVWVVDPHLRPTGRNVAWERYTGQTPTDYAQLGWLTAVHPADRGRFQEEAARALASGEALTTEFRIRRADGSYRRNLIRAVPVREDGVIVEWIGTATDIEEARQAADDLAAVEERLRLAHAAAGVGTWEWHLERNEVRWSSEIFAMLGLEADATPDAALWSERIHPEDREQVEARWAEALASDRTHFTDTFRLVLPDGSLRWILTSAVIFRQSSGPAVRAVGLNMDVTAQRTLQEQMEAALAEQRDLRARLLALTDGADSLLAARDEPTTRARVLDMAQRVLPADAYAIWWLDPDSGEWRIVHAVGLSEEYTHETIAGEPLKFTQPLAVDDVTTEDLLETRRAAYVREGIVSLLTIPLPIHGERRATLVTYHRTRHATTETELRVGMALGQIAAAALANAETNAEQDRSRHAAERHALRMAFLADASAALGSLEYETTLRQVAQMAVPRIADWCAVDIVQPDGSVARLVTAHVDPDKVRLAQELQQRYPPKPDAATGVAFVLRTGQPQFFPVISDELLAAAARDDEHLRILRALGLHSVFIAPLTARGRTLGALTFVTATPEHTLSDDDVTVLTEVGRRAALAIDNARLYRDVELANRSKDEFLALLSHELRTPLNAIMGWSHMLRQGLPPDMQQHALEVIGRNAQSQKQLVEDLLDVARIASGKLDLQRRPVDLGEIARVAVDSALPGAQAKGLTLSLEAPPRPVRVHGDANRLQQVTANLLSNAVKFTDTGGRITVRVMASDAAGTLAVADTGTGIAADFLPHMFERFRQADTSLTRAYSGLGLGLWVVKQIVEAHGGHVQAESQGPGQGATVAFTIPNP